MNDERTGGFEGAGGTPGGVGHFLVGLVLTISGAYLLTNQVTVTSGFWRWWDHSAFGLSLVPLLLGVGMLFFNGRSIVGWLLALAGVVIIFAGILVNLDIYFRPTSLFNTLIMLIMLIGGIGLVGRSLKSRDGNRPDAEKSE